jgi:hypothetical protein
VLRVLGTTAVTGGHDDHHSGILGTSYSFTGKIAAFVEDALVTTEAHVDDICAVFDCPVDTFGYSEVTSTAASEDLNRKNQRLGRDSGDTVAVVVTGDLGGDVGAVAVDVAVLIGGQFAVEHRGPSVENPPSEIRVRTVNPGVEDGDDDVSTAGDGPGLRGAYGGEAPLGVTQVDSGGDRRLGVGWDDRQEDSGECGGQHSSVFGHGIEGAPLGRVSTRTRTDRDGWSPVSGAEPRTLLSCRDPVRPCASR